ncbi:ATP-dependent metallopeptidase FtsH/Yme1/Tma family protein [Paludibacter sp. 221]|uniref:ATP-dependent zinc metalloprotease FtsH n=1 Tax=Paludibacter sp. 221 TaxID=2302939 RepID=UPI0013D600BC|nr:ATP-dependent zinc metalloprotease FtsH [Paludibacter sp. 221]NDV46451.1 ATP-dependent metallopeptidase FtsH/Yme1/Tma family protein [Paludibacter sp. 221]
MENKRPDGNPNNNNPKNPNEKKFKFNFSWIYGLIILILLGSYFFSDTTPSKDVPFSTFEEYVKNGSIEKIQVYTSRNTLEATVAAEAANEVFGSRADSYKDRMITVRIPSVEEFSKFIQKAKDEYGYTGVVDYKEGRNYFELFLYSFFPIILLIVFIVYMNRRMMGQSGGGGGVFNVGKSKAQLFDKSAANKVTFKDVAGLEGAKQEVEEIVEFLKNPTKYTQLGGKIPKGALLVGPPGTGKTLLAKAVAGEADVPFFSMSGSDFVEMFVGVGASRVRDLFRQAKEKAPCIIFIDEIDAIGRARGKNPNMGSNDERENTLNQLLTEMDGFGTNSGVIILAATNRADILDKALLRAGRFDRQIHVDLPDIQERKEIFNVHLRPIKIDESVDVDFLARQTPGFSGADIANVCNEAALIAARKNKDFVGKQDFLDAVDRIIGGLEKKTKITTVSEKKSIAYHEAGHATISWMLEHANPLFKVTIVPRGEALGAAWYLPEERQLTNKEHLLDEMCSTLGGRAAEEVFLNQTSTGAINDLERVTKRAYAMVAYFGMSDKMPNMSYYDSTGQSDYGFTKPYSEKTAELIDKEAKEIVAEQFERAKKILKEHAKGHNELAELLIEREVIFAEDMERIFGKRPWTSRNEELMALNERAKQKKEAEKTEIKAEDIPDAPVQPEVKKEPKVKKTVTKVVVKEEDKAAAEEKPKERKPRVKKDKPDETK